ncbi:DUF2513 domain-containing protein [Methylocystis sp. H4A]|uniref:DUF2513 domain-containing protein n=1 Tax=Methylocystis sp. H4A TaxID=2785788 RepID=UPI0018C23DED|nr:DUF2513 domain-containing protein [Methylocystis sp. H4A]MBG0803820.1 DUF2513 domain-containing protein [Methylocystis sp. H4A]
MKRDMDLVREILLKLEPLPAHFDNPIPLIVGAEPLVFKGRSADEIAYHIRIMTQGDLISMGGIDANGHIASYYGFRWLGHEFLDDVRDPEIWRKIRARVKGIGGAGLGLMWEIAKAEIKIQLGLP